VHRRGQRRIGFSVARGEKTGGARPQTVAGQIRRLIRLLGKGPSSRPSGTIEQTHVRVVAARAAGVVFRGRPDRQRQYAVHRGGSTTNPSTTSRHMSKTFAELGSYLSEPVKNIFYRGCGLGFAVRIVAGPSIFDCYLIDEVHRRGRAINASNAASHEELFEKNGPIAPLSLASHVGRGD